MVDQVELGSFLLGHLEKIVEGFCWGCSACNKVC